MIPIPQVGKQVHPGKPFAQSHKVPQADRILCSRPVLKPGVFPSISCRSLLSSLHREGLWMPESGGGGSLPTSNPPPPWQGPVVPPRVGQSACHTKCILSPMLTACRKSSDYHHAGLAGDGQPRGGAEQPRWVKSLLACLLAEQGPLSSQRKAAEQLLSAFSGCPVPGLVLGSAHVAAHLTSP